jgi:hypothetical protein
LELVGGIAVASIGAELGVGADALLELALLFLPMVVSRFIFVKWFWFDFATELRMTNGPSQTLKRFLPTNLKYEVWQSSVKLWELALIGSNYR